MAAGGGIAVRGLRPGKGAALCHCGGTFIGIGRGIRRYIGRHYPRRFGECIGSTGSRTAPGKRIRRVAGSRTAPGKRIRRVAGSRTAPGKRPQSRRKPDSPREAHPQGHRKPDSSRETYLQSHRRLPIRRPLQRREPLRIPPRLRNIRQVPGHKRVTWW